MTTRKKEYALKALRDWLNTVRNRDEVTGAPTKKNINYIFSKRILNEIINHQPGGNYDLLSALLLLMILFSQLDDLSPEDEYQDYTQGYEVERLQLEAQRAPTDYRRRQPSFFERM